jgi:hypothetical protein
VSLGAAAIPAVTKSQEIGPLLFRAIEFEAWNYQILSPTELASQSSALARATKELGANLVWGGSRFGDRLIGAVLLDSPELALWNPNCRPEEHVVLLDGAVGDPSQIEFTAWTLRQAGVERVDAVIVAMQSAASPRGFDRIVVLGS